MAQSKANSNRTTNLAFILILVGYAVYAAVFIWKTSFVFQGVRYFSLFDDTMISMQFAKNLAHGAGMVWNAGGARVEGFTNPLWVVFMALWQMLPIPDSKISLALQISGGVFFIASLYYVKKITELVSGHRWMAVLAVFVCAFYYPFSTWSLMGLEVSALLLVVTAAAYLALRQTYGEQKAPFSIWIYIILGVGTLLRVDAAVPYIVLWAYLIWFDKANRRKHLLLGGLVLVVFLGGQTVARLLYYGDWLPNTYYLKMEGFPLLLRLERGIYVFAKFAWNLGPIFFLLPLLLLFFRRDRTVLLMALLFAAQVAYSIYVGGDAWEHRGGSNRFITLGMPFFMILFVMVSYYLFNLLRQHSLKEFSGRWQKFAVPGANLVLFGFVFLALVNFNVLLDGNSLKQWVLIDPNIFAPGSQHYVRDGVLLAEVTTPDARIAVAAAGNIPFFDNRFSIDLLGKVDPVIAHEAIHSGPRGEGLLNLQPGHLKWDYARSIGEQKPDIIVDLILNTDAEVAPYLVDYQKVSLNGQTMYFRTGSQNILWDKIGTVEQ